MTLYRERQRKTLFYRLLSGFVAVNFLLHSAVPGYSQGLPGTVLNLPVPGTMVTPSPAFHPALITGITVYPQNPTQFDFIIDIGDDRLQGEALRRESQKLINYFMAALTVPEEELWVNLSPYEKDRIIASGLSQTEMGRDMLAQDYLLKQLTASLMYPEEEFGQEFWKRVYDKAYTQYGTTEIPLDTFNKVWIVPENAVVYVHERSVFVAESHLKVMLEEDYLALESNVGSTAHGLGSVSKDDLVPVSGMAAKIVREILLPEIEREVNEGRNFANLRQIYHAMILATWYKKNLKESLLGKIYIDRNKVAGIDIEDKQIKDKIYNQYLEAFKKGVYNYIREDYNPATRQMIPRKYFSGGLKGVSTVIAQETVSSPLNSAMRRPHVVVAVKTENVADPVGSSPINRKSPALFEHLLVRVERLLDKGEFDRALGVLRGMIRTQKETGVEEIEGYINDAKEVYFQGLWNEIGKEGKVNERVKKKLYDMIRLQRELGNESTSKLIKDAKGLVFFLMFDELRDERNPKSLVQAEEIHQDMIDLKELIGSDDTNLDFFIVMAKQYIDKKVSSHGNISSDQKSSEENALLEKMSFSPETGYYLFLEVRPGASLEEIEEAWTKRKEDFKAGKITPKVMELVMDAYVVLKDKKVDEHKKRQSVSSPISEEQDPFKNKFNQINAQLRYGSSAENRPDLELAKDFLLEMVRMQKTTGNDKTRQHLDNAIRLYFQAAQNQIVSMVFNAEDLYVLYDDLMQKLIDMVDLQADVQRKEITDNYVATSKRHVFLETLYDIQRKLKPDTLDRTSLDEAKGIFRKMESLLTRVGSDETIQRYFDSAKDLLTPKGSVGENPVSSPISWDESSQGEDVRLFNQVLSMIKEGSLGVALNILREFIKMQKENGNQKTEQYVNAAKNAYFNAYFVEIREKISSHGITEEVIGNLLDMIGFQNEMGNETTQAHVNSLREHIFEEMLEEIYQSKSLDRARKIYKAMVSLQDKINENEPFGENYDSLFLEEGAEVILRGMLSRLTNENDEDVAKEILKEMLQMENRLQGSKIISELVDEAVIEYEENFPSAKVAGGSAMGVEERKFLFSDYYAILNVPFAASSEDIENAFIKRKKELEDLKDVSSKGREARQSNLEEAYNTLINPQLRAEYDKKYKSQQSSSPVASQGADYGGIDLNPQNLELKQRGEDMRFQFIVPENLDPAAIQGIRPVIINVTPVINFPLLLGLSQQNEKTI